MGGHLFGPTLSIFIGLIHIHSSTSQMHPPMNGPSMEPTQPFHNIWPDRRGHVRPNPSSPPSCRNNPCQNSGTCIDTNNVTVPFICKCRPLYLGRLCEVVVKSPKKLKLIEKGAHHLRVSWEPPNVNKVIYGYMVQHHQFGTNNITRSDLIHPSTLQYTIQNLDEDTQYTVCINIVFDSETSHEAVLREQCLEVKTQSTMISLTSIAPVAIICTAVFALVLLIFVVILCLSKKKGQKQQNSGTFTSMSWRRGNPTNGYQDQSYLTDKELNDSVQFNDEMFHNSPYTQNQTNNASRDSCGDDVFYKYKPQPKEIYMNQHNFARSCSVSAAPSWSNPENQLRDSRCQSTSLASFQSKHKRTSSVPHTSFRELPPSISNHMMRSPTARDKDATSEFDVGSYFLPRS